MIEQSLILVKPDGVQRGLVGEIVRRFENIGLKIVGMKMVWVDKNLAKKHYSAHTEKKFYPGLEKFITEGPVIALVLEGVHAIETIRKIVGSTEPKTAPPGTIRGDFAHMSYEYADGKGVTIKNIIHASGDKKDAKKEVSLWFSVDELHSYENVFEKHMR